MKKLMTTIALASALCISAQSVYAGDYGRKDRPTAEQKMERMAERLNLNEEQKKNILLIKKEEFEKIKSLRQENRKRIEGYLTDEQKQMMNDRKRDCNKAGGKKYRQQ